MTSDAYADPQAQTETVPAVRLDALGRKDAAMADLERRERMRDLGIKETTMPELKPTYILATPELLASCEEHAIECVEVQGGQRALVFQKYGDDEYRYVWPTSTSPRAYIASASALCLNISIPAVRDRVARVLANIISPGAGDGMNAPSVRMQPAVEITPGGREEPPELVIGDIIAITDDGRSYWSSDTAACPGIEELLGVEPETDETLILALALAWKAVNA